MQHQIKLFRGQVSAPKSQLNFVLTLLVIPDAKLHQMKTILKDENEVIQHPRFREPPLINIGKWGHLREVAMDALCPQALPTESSTREAVAYIRRGLQHARVDEDNCDTLKEQINQKEDGMPGRIADIARRTGFAPSRRGI
jgi:hypothetical protein